MQTPKNEPFQAPVGFLYDPGVEFFEKEILTPQEASCYLKISQRTLGRLVKANKIPFKRLGRQLRFSVEVLKEWIKEGG